MFGWIKEWKQISNIFGFCLYNNYCILYSDYHNTYTYSITIIEIGDTYKYSTATHTELQHNMRVSHAVLNTNNYPLQLQEKENILMIIT